MVCNRLPWCHVRARNASCRRTSIMYNNDRIIIKKYIKHFLNITIIVKKKKKNRISVSFQRVLSHREDVKNPSVRYHFISISLLAGRMNEVRAPPSSCRFIRRLLGVIWSRITDNRLSFTASYTTHKQFQRFPDSLLTSKNILVGTSDRNQILFKYNSRVVIFFYTIF